MTPVQISRSLSKAVSTLSFGAPITHVYNPLVYAARSHEQYENRFARPECEVLFLGMNPGPWGMAQTGVPFGEVTLVRDWMGIEAKVDKPVVEHPKRPVTGFACTRSEVSGKRLWGWAQERFGTPDDFFPRFYVHNYCPLSFMEASGRNFTPDKLKVDERAPLYEACDEALRQLVNYLQPEYVLGVGGFAEKRIRAALVAYDGVIGRILHPSPASPAANRGWAALAESDLADLGIDV